MNIKTRFNLNEKVWFLTPTENKYMWGEIKSFDITNRCGIIETIYHIENRFYDKNRFALSLYKSDWRTEFLLSFKEDYIFSTVAELFDFQETQKDKSLIELTELKKGIFG